MDGKVVKVFSCEEVTLNPGETKKVYSSFRINNLNFWSWGYGYLYTVFTRLKLDNVVVDEVQPKRVSVKQNLKTAWFI